MDVQTNRKRFNKFEEGAAEGTIRSAMCRLIYTDDLFRADKNGKYGCGVLVPRDADTTHLQKVIAGIIGEQAKKDQEIAKKPFRKTADIASLERYAEEFPLFFRCGTSKPPEIVGASRQAIEEDYGYSGRWGRVVLFPKWYPSIDGSKPGVKLYLNTVQFLNDAERIGGSRASAEDDFEAVDEPDALDGSQPSAADVGSLFD